MISVLLSVFTDDRLLVMRVNRGSIFLWDLRERLFRMEDIDPSTVFVDCDGERRRLWYKVDP